MKKYLFIAALAALAFTSCQQENDVKENNNNVNGGKNSVSFVLQSGAPTRSGEVVSPVRRGFYTEIGQVDGEAIYIEETITELGYSTPETRGTPLYTENLGYLYRSKMDVHTSTYTGADVTYYQIGDEQAIEDYWCYGYDYPTNIWGDQNTDVHFAFRMPSSMTTKGVSNLSFTGNATTFDYTSPETAEETLDIVFGGVTKTFKEYLNDYARYGGTKVKLYHALTGVKFAIANSKKADGSLEYDIQIKEISFKGLANGGTCTFTPGATGLDGGDINWTTTTTDTDNVISQTFTADDLVDYAKPTTGEDPNHFADSYYSAGTKQNINDAQATKTFWLVPQSISDSDAVLTIKFSMNGVDNQTMEIKLSDLYNGNSSDWEPAQIRTYTFKLNDVNLKVDDDVTLAGNADTGYEGSVKKNVTITNTGNTRAFIRASIVGQWMNDITNAQGQIIESNPIFGFTDKINGLHEVPSWYQDQFVSTATGVHGQFAGLAGYKNGTNPLNDWQLCDDGYYYYMLPVEPGTATGSALFTSYTVGEMPMPDLAGAEVEHANMHFELEISTQAIAANKLDGIAEAWDTAWEKATGKKPVKKTN